jgi:hypothetical protein
MSRIQHLPQRITIDGRGMTIQDAITEMWSRIRPLTDKGYNPISGVQIVDSKSNEIIQTFLLDDPDFRKQIVEDKEAHKASVNDIDKAHEPESKEHFRYLARIELA